MRDRERETARANLLTPHRITHTRDTLILNATADYYDVYYTARERLSEIYTTISRIRAERVRNKALLTHFFWGCAGAKAEHIRMRYNWPRNSCVKFNRHKSVACDEHGRIGSGSGNEVRVIRGIYGDRPARQPPHGKRLMRDERNTRRLAAKRERRMREVVARGARLIRSYMHSVRRAWVLQRVMLVLCASLCLCIVYNKTYSNFCSTSPGPWKIINPIGKGSVCVCVSRALKFPIG